MNTHDALTASILGNPQDDTPRLVFADFLEENGEDDRSSFIRVQVELARTNPVVSVMPSHDWDATEYARVKELRRREMDLLDHHWHEWSGRMFTYLSTSGQGFESLASGVGYERGFPNRAACSWDFWLRHHERLYWHPTQTVECPKCRGSGEMDEATKSLASGKTYWRSGKHKTCSGTGLIPRPFVPTCQPITAVTLTTWPDRIGSTSDRTGLLTFTARMGSESVRFSRVTCPEDDRLGPSNQWTCPAWPTVVFEMPTGQDYTRQPRRASP